eukprot:370341-Pleurochrysis_carterae.AAC.1
MPLRRAECGLVITASAPMRRVTRMWHGQPGGRTRRHSKEWSMQTRTARGRASTDAQTHVWCETWLQAWRGKAANVKRGGRTQGRRS